MMKALLRGLFGLIAALALGGTAMAADLENTLYLDVPAGRVVIEMRPDLAPEHVAQIKALARRGFYDGVPFIASSTASWRRRATRPAPARAAPATS